MADGTQVIVQLVDERDPRRNVQLDDIRVGNIVEVFDEGAETVPVGRNQDLLTRTQLRGD